MIFQITERLAVDDEVGFSCDTARGAALINAHRSVAVGTFFEAMEVLQNLGFTDASIRILFEKAAEGHTLDEIFATLGWGGQDAISR